MGVEIERKFLVCGAGWEVAEPKAYCQGYLSRTAERTVRIRIGGDSAYITVKGKSQGATRLEFEYPIPVEDARQMLELCEQPLIEKTRRVIPIGGHHWEVDEFEGANAGLVIAEIELSSEDEVFEKPAWVGQEVTSERRYFNSQLSLHPWPEWPENRQS